jgi:hypothetical protein
MRHIFIGFIIFTITLSAFAERNDCELLVHDYKVKKDSGFIFSIVKKKACFFAFYTTNPNPMIDMKGNGNMGDALWYGYYFISDPHKIYEFPKPLDDGWSGVCSISAVSFLPMHGNKKRDVTVIGSCDKNPINYTFPFVFIRDGDSYVLDKKVYHGLYGFIGLTINDVRDYIKSPKRYYRILENQDR